MTNEGHKGKMKENRQCLIRTIESLQYLGHQGLALMKIIWLEKKNKTQKYTSYDIQNEILMLTEVLSKH